MVIFSLTSCPFQILKQLIFLKEINTFVAFLKLNTKINTAKCFNTAYKVKHNGDKKYFYRVKFNNYTK